jgi:hypothetical protein
MGFAVDGAGAIAGASFGGGGFDTTFGVDFDAADDDGAFDSVDLDSGADADAGADTDNGAGVGVGTGVGMNSGIRIGFDGEWRFLGSARGSGCKDSSDTLIGCGIVTGGRLF